LIAIAVGWESLLGLKLDQRIASLATKETGFDNVVGEKTRSDQSLL